MIKINGKDIQLTFEFNTSNQKIRFIKTAGKCKCGYTEEFKKADIVLEMTVICPECGSVMRLK